MDSKHNAEHNASPEPASEQMSDIDNWSINSISFVPTKIEVDELIKHSVLANKDILDKTRSSLLSKMFKLPGKFGLLPDSVDPQDTILCKLGKNKGKIWQSDSITIMDDRNMPFGGKSNGPNGILVNCNTATYGFNRVNLFHINAYSTRILLEDYLKFRNKNIVEIFDDFTQKLHSHLKTFKIDLSKDEQLPEAQHENYRLTCSMFNMINTQLKKGKSLEWCGMGCVSFCQTWLKNGEQVGDAQFSVMSPHFQTRFYVTSDDKLLFRCGVTEGMRRGYIGLIKYFTESMGEYGSCEAGKGGQCFVNCDKIYELELIQ